MRRPKGGVATTARVPLLGRDGAGGGGGNVALAATCSAGDGGAPAAGAPLAFEQAQLEAATSGFASNMKLDEGSFGTVFRGALADGRLVAIKVLKPEAAAAIKEGAEEWAGAAGFRKELEVLGKYKHQNIVELIGYALDDGGSDGAAAAAAANGGWLSRGRGAGAPPPKQCLIFEFMAGGSLKQRLAPPSADEYETAPPMTCTERFDVASDIARGLAFLHIDADPPIIHQDVKSANVLLGYSKGRLIAKVADFGTARFLAPNVYDQTRDHHTTANVVGTTPYMSMEYIQQGHCSTKTDTFAFGVVLLELLTGRPPYDSASREMLSLSMWPIIEKPEQHQLSRYLDQQARDWPVAKATALARIAKRCTEPFAANRCAVKDVLADIDKLAGRGAQPRHGGGMEQTGGVILVVGATNTPAPGGAEFDAFSGAPLNTEARHIAAARGGGGGGGGGGSGAARTSAEQAPGSPLDRAPSSRQSFSSAQSAGLRNQGPHGLVGAQVRVFDSGAEGRVGVVTGIAKAFGGSSKHVIVFDGSRQPENVLLQKSTGGKGERFHVLESSRLAAAGDGGGGGGGAGARASDPAIESAFQTLPDAVAPTTGQQRAAEMTSGHLVTISSSIANE